jgi:hypothetical protein
MPSQEDILRKAVEEIRPLQKAIDANLRELEDEQRRNQEQEKQRKIREERYRILAGELVGEAESMMQSLCDRLIHSGFDIETAYPTEGVYPKCMLEIEPTLDFPKAFWVTLQFPSDPDLNGVIEIVVCTSATKGEAGRPVSNMRFSLDDCERDELRQWIHQSMALAVKQYFEKRAKRDVGG